MKLTKAQLKQIIKEEFIKEMYQYQPTDPTSAMNKIKEIVDEALMNKSFSDPASGEWKKYWQRIIYVLKSPRGGRSTVSAAKLRRYPYVRSARHRRYGQPASRKEIEEWDPGKGFGSNWKRYLKRYLKGQEE